MDGAKHPTGLGVAGERQEELIAMDLWMSHVRNHLKQLTVPLDDLDAAYAQWRKAIGHPLVAK
jgi:hypothetical protein